jgi:hypothetical protein
MDAWRTSCPRLPVWEDAKDRGLVMCIVRITSSGPWSANKKEFGSFLFARENEAARAADATACEMQAFETVV